jgi:hypothetical protein
MPNVDQPEGSAPEPTGPRAVPSQTPRPAGSSINPIGRWQAYHPSWQGVMEFNDKGQFTSGPRGYGTWSFDGRTLRLQWSTPRPPELLELQEGGTFRGNDGFVLRKC